MSASSGVIVFWPFGVFFVNDGMPVHVAGGGSRQSFDSIATCDGAFMIQFVRFSRFSVEVPPANVDCGCRGG